MTVSVHLMFRPKDLLSPGFSIHLYTFITWKLDEREGIVY